MAEANGPKRPSRTMRGASLSANPLGEALRATCPSPQAAGILIGSGPGGWRLVERLASTTPGADVEQFLALCGRLGMRFRMPRPDRIRLSVPRAAVDALWRCAEFRKRCGLPPDVPTSRGQMALRVRRLYAGAGRGVGADRIAERFRSHWLPTIAGSREWSPRNIKRMVRRRRGAYPPVRRADDPIVPRLSFLREWRPYAFEALVADAFWFAPLAPSQQGLLEARFAGGRMIVESEGEVPAAWTKWAAESVARRPYGATLGLAVRSIAAAD